MTTPFKIQTVSISTGATGLSSAISLEGYIPHAIQLSTAWTNAAITLQGSQDETNYFNVYTSTGGEVSFTCTANRYLVITDPERFIGLKALKLRSGTSGAAVAQAAARTLKLVTRAG